EDGDQVVADVEPHAGIVERLEAALVRREFFRILAPAAEKEAEGEEHHADGPCHAEENQDRDVLVQHVDRNSATSPRSADNCISPCRLVGARRLDFQPARSSIGMVPTVGLEPTRLAPLPPQDSVSTNSTTSA